MPLSILDNLPPKDAFGAVNVAWRFLRAVVCGSMRPVVPTPSCIAPGTIGRVLLVTFFTSGAECRLLHIFARPIMMFGCLATLEQTHGAARETLACVGLMEGT